MPNWITARVLAHFVAFIESQGKQGWNEFWAEGGEGFVRAKASAILRERCVLNRSGDTDGDAVDEVVSLVSLKLLRIATCDLAGGFDVERSGDSPAALACWLKRVVHSQVHDHIREYRCTRNGVKFLSFEGLELNDGPATTDAVERHDRAAKQFVARDLVMHFMNKLHESDRRILDLAFFRGLTQREIARELRVSPATACRLVQDAKNRLKKLIDPKTGGI